MLAVSVVRCSLPPLPLEEGSRGGIQQAESIGPGAVDMPLPLKAVVIQEGGIVPSPPPPNISLGFKIRLR